MPRRKRWSEANVNRDAEGRFANKLSRNLPGPGGKQQTYGERVKQLRAAGAKAEIAEDRKDKRLRFGKESEGYWYMPRGPYYWVKQGKKDEMINGRLYRVGRKFSLINISENGGQHWVPSDRDVPDDIWQAAQLYPGEMAGETGVTRAGVAARRTAANRKPTTPARKRTVR